MKILVLGSGGREHALAWRIAKSRGLDSVGIHPGNAGTRAKGFQTLGDGDFSTASRIAIRARELGVSLIVIGPEALLAEGYADTLRAEGFLVVGPNQNGARLETSKIFAKEFMTRAGVPTASFRTASSHVELLSAVDTLPIVVKLDGLAAGKGVVVAQTKDEIRDFGDRIWRQGEFGPGPHRVLIETCLEGRELSYMGLCDGERFVPLPSATDFKRIGDGDTGPNTGGMGAVSPSPYLTPALEKKITENVVVPILTQLKHDRIDFRGVLYIGFMITPQGEPYVLEFNTRFGDPETQAIMMRLDGDFPKWLEMTARATLIDAGPLPVTPDPSVYVVAAAEGYPAKPVTGDSISGHEALQNSELFFAGVSEKAGKLCTAGGRVLGVGSTAATVREARDRSYSALSQIRFRGMQFRKDIAASFT